MQRRKESARREPRSYQTTTANAHARDGSRMAETAPTSELGSRQPCPKGAASIEAYVETVNPMTDSFGLEDFTCTD